MRWRKAHNNKKRKAWQALRARLSARLTVRDIERFLRKAVGAQPESDEEWRKRQRRELLELAQAAFDRCRPKPFEPDIVAAGATAWTDAEIQALLDTPDPDKPLDQMRNFLNHLKTPGRLSTRDGAILAVRTRTTVNDWLTQQPMDEAELAGTHEDDSYEPDIDDSVKCCPECETPNQFGELCDRCRREIEAEV